MSLRLRSRFRHKSGFVFSTATENLLVAKGFSEAVVTILSDSVDVVVNADDLTESQIAQIEDIVKRKTECSADKIVISPVGKKK